MAVGRPIPPLLLNDEERATFQRRAKRVTPAQAPTAAAPSPVRRPRLFVWTKTAGEILGTIANYCQRINDS